MLMPKETSGEFNYYSAESVTPMEDGVLVCPFDSPTCLLQNKEAGAITGWNKIVYDARDLLENDNSKPIREILDSRGFSIISHVSKVNNFWDEDELIRVHYPELKVLAQSLTGCDCTAVAAHALRIQGDKQKENLAATTPNSRGAAYTVHNDFCDLLKDQFIEQIEIGDSVITKSVEKGGLGLSSIDEFRRGRLSVINFWRPMCQTPLKRNPLAILDATSIGESDIILCRHPWKPENKTFLKHYLFPVPFINTLIRHNSSHRWYYYPDQTRDEVLVFKNYDSIRPTPFNGVGMHTSFDDPNTLPSDPPRESLETRVLCFWYDK